MNSNILLLVFQLVVLLFSVIIHEISHGVMALRLGDHTARLAGRLTINPTKHLDPVGSFLVPLALFFLTNGSLVFGWARPVPYNPFNLKDPKRGAGIIAAAGPISNLILAIIFGILFRLTTFAPPSDSLIALAGFFQIVIIINIALAVFNLLPIPPLDGAGILFSFLKPGQEYIQRFLMRYGFIILLLFVFFGFDIIRPIIFGLYHLIAGG